MPSCDKTLTASAWSNATISMWRIELSIRDVSHPNVKHLSGAVFLARLQSRLLSELQSESRYSVIYDRSHVKEIRAIGKITL
jgi:hypothetical protein